MADTPTDSLLKLPPELRLSIYDLLLADIGRAPEHIETYMLPSEWPTRERFAAFNALLRTCKPIEAEAKAHFETVYLPKTVVYFDNVPDLYDFCKAVQRLGPAYERIKASLHSGYDRLSDMLDCPQGMSRGSTYTNEDTLYFMQLQPDYNNELIPGSHGDASKATLHLFGGTQLNWHLACADLKLPWRYPRLPGLAEKPIHLQRNGRRIDVVLLPKANGEEPAASFSMHWLCGQRVNRLTGYMEMTCAVKDLSWARFNLKAARKHWMEHQSDLRREDGKLSRIYESLENESAQWLGVRD